MGRGGGRRVVGHHTEEHTLIRIASKEWRNSRHATTRSAADASSLCLSSNLGILFFLVVNFFSFSHSHLFSINFFFPYRFVKVSITLGRRHCITFPSSTWFQKLIQKSFFLSFFLRSFFFSLLISWWSGITTPNYSSNVVCIAEDAKM